MSLTYRGLIALALFASTLVRNVHLSLCSSLVSGGRSK